MTTFLLIRHGLTDAVDKVMAGWMEGWPLNRTGRMQVQRLAEGLSRRRLDAVYTSPLERAIDTAGPIAQAHGLKPQVCEDLGELRIGAWEGRLIEELDTLEEWRRFNERRRWVRPPGGELASEVQTRMVQRMNCLRLRHTGETVAVVSHGDPLR